MSKSAVIELKESVIPNITNDWEAYVDYDDDRIVYGILASDELIEYADQARYLLGFMPCFHNFELAWTMMVTMTSISSRI